MIYVLIVLACLGARCERFEAGVVSCSALGLAQVAAWAGEHPGWVVRRWECGEARA